MPSPWWSFRNHAKVRLPARNAACCPLSSRVAPGIARQILVSLSRTSSAMNASLVIVRMMMVVNGNCAAGLRDPAAHVLELNGRVADRKTLGEHFVEPAKNGIARRWRNIFDQNVAAQRMRARSQAPDVQVVHLQHAFDRFGGGRYLGELHPARKPFEQNIQ